MNYAFAPPIFGLQAEAIKQFETLREQQETRPPEERFARTYLLLGNLYQNQGNLENAREVRQTSKRGASVDLKSVRRV